MKRPVTISLSPNVEADDVELARRMLHQPESWRNERVADQLAQKISALFGGRPVTMTSSGRQALYLLLKDLGVGAGDEVIIQAFTCIAVPAAIQWAGAKPVYADIQRETLNLNPARVREKITERTKAIIVQHTFGIPGPVEELQAMARAKKLTLIEDCAHALGVRYRDQLLGTFGDAAFLSFGRDKMLSSVFGGAIVGRDMKNDLPLPPAWWVRQQLRHPIFFQAILPWYFQLGLGKAALVAAQWLGFLSKAVVQEEKVGGMPKHAAWKLSPALARLAQHQFEKLSRYTARRQEIARRYQKQFGGPAGVLRYPLVRANAPEILRAARARMMLLGDWYNAALAPAGARQDAFGYRPGMCPEAEWIAKRVLNLPTYPTLTEEQVEHVINFITQYGDS